MSYDREVSIVNGFFIDSSKVFKLKKYHGPPCYCKERKQKDKFCSSCGETNKPIKIEDLSVRNSYEHLFYTYHDEKTDIVHAEEEKWEGRLLGYKIELLSFMINNTKTWLVGCSVDATDVHENNHNMIPIPKHIKKELLAYLKDQKVPVISKSYGLHIISQVM